MRVLLLLTVFLFSTAGCSTLSDRGYSEVSVGYKFNETEYDLEFDDRCFLSITLEGGVRFENVSVAYRHSSNLDCGPPLNDKSEPHSDQILVKYTFN